ncbi:MAG: preprotein translocase subunit SecA [Clostridia bacterium]|nr:preprotein translocase subunit SecA [Clostridia bacterium]
MGLIESIFGSHSDREIKRLRPIIEQIASLENEYRSMGEAELKGSTDRFRARLADGESLDDLLPEAYAAVGESARRVIGQYPFRTQYLGGVVLHQGRIAELKTGEGKTLMATLPAYLNALTGQGVHVVTVNDYLARRDSEWMGKIYRYLGLSVGLIVHGLDNNERRRSYACDITYGTNNEYGFDYLRDNMVTYKEQMVQRGLSFAIVDEVDSILIDEARTPLIISGMGTEATDLYAKADQFVRRLSMHVVTESDDKLELESVSASADYIVDEKARTAVLTPSGVQKAERFFGIANLADEENYQLQHHINNALKAHGTMHLDQAYVVKDGEVIIVDDFTGRLMFGRRYSDGLHQAIEAKEGVKIERENKTLATITFQNYFRMYRKLSGMTGTAATEENEFREIYNLDVVCVPTNRPMIREDLPDAVYKTVRGKYQSILEEVREIHTTGQPILIGTVSVEKSEILSELFRKNGIEHNVLNAKQHQREAEIVAQAGRFGAVTIATNMAGRGTDILLGGNPDFLARQDLRRQGFDEELIEASTAYNDTDDEVILDARRRFKELRERFKLQTDEEHQRVVEVGGLCIIGTERHESRRIDNQLRGRSGRQGDPGRSRFYLSLEDDLMRLFGGDRIQGLFGALGVAEDMQIEHRMLSNVIESAQKRVEGRNFGIRKTVLEYDDVMNQQRNLIYEQRRKVLDGNDLHDTYRRMLLDVCEDRVRGFCHDDVPSAEWDASALAAAIRDQFGDLPSLRGLGIRFREGAKVSDTIDMLANEALDRYDTREKELGQDLMREAERLVMLRVVDEKWMDHIDMMDDLRDSIGMRGYAQHNPVIEYKMEGFEMFESMNRSIREDAVRLMMRATFSSERPIQRKSAVREVTEGFGSSGFDAGQGGASSAAPSAQRTLPAGPRASAPRPQAVNPESEARTPARRDAVKVGRNDPCPCGSGKKYKNCCGKNE